MDMRRIDDGFAVAGQITAEDVVEIASAGFRTLISNRPDAEDGAVPHSKIEEAAAAANLAFHYLPVISGALSEQNVIDMSELLETAEKPVLAYCRSGARCTHLYGFVQQIKSR